MCEICDAVVEREEVEIPCGYCQVPIKTFWAAHGGGLLHGDFYLIADAIFHKPCWDKLMEGYDTDRHNFSPF